MRYAVCLLFVILHRSQDSMGIAEDPENPTL